MLAGWLATPKVIDLVRSSTVGLCEPEQTFRPQRPVDFVRRHMQQAECSARALQQHESARNEVCCIGELVDVDHISAGAIEQVPDRPMTAPRIERELDFRVNGEAPLDPISCAQLRGLPGSARNCAWSTINSARFRRHDLDLPARRFSRQRRRASCGLPKIVVDVSFASMSGVKNAAPLIDPSSKFPCDSAPITLRCTGRIAHTRFE